MGPLSSTCHVLTAIHTCCAPLQADSGSTLRGRLPSYRQILLLITERLQIKCPSTLLTQVRSCLELCFCGRQVCLSWLALSLTAACAGNSPSLLESCMHMLAQESEASTGIQLFIAGRVYVQPRH